MCIGVEGMGVLGGVQVLAGAGERRPGTKAALEGTGGEEQDACLSSGGRG